MPEVSRIGEIIELLQRFVLNEIALSGRQVKVALRLLDLAIPDAPRPDDGAEVLKFADGRLVFPFSRKFSA